MRIFFLSLMFVSAQSQASSDGLSASCHLFGGPTESAGPALRMNHYEVTSKSCTLNGKTWWALRQFSSGGKTFLLIANPESLKTQILAGECIRCTEASLKDLPDSRYKRQLEKQQSLPEALANFGLTHASNDSRYYLSVDLCPSRKPFDASIFENEKIKNADHFPAAIALSGGWLSHYPEEFAGLKSRALSGALDIVWVNHSYTHPYHPGVPNKDNFLLSPEVNFADEVLKQEQYMISNGVTPSLFFRFPGLISSKNLIERLSGYGLIALGADAWLALGQKPRPGSIVLIHGNGNEEYGVRLFMKFLDTIADVGVFQNLTSAP